MPAHTINLNADKISLHRGLSNDRKYMKLSECQTIPIASIIYFLINLQQTFHCRTTNPVLLDNYETYVFHIKILLIIVYVID